MLLVVFVFLTWANELTARGLFFLELEVNGEKKFEASMLKKIERSVSKMQQLFSLTWLKSSCSTKVQSSFGSRCLRRNKSAKSKTRGVIQSSKSAMDQSTKKRRIKRYYCGKLIYLRFAINDDAWLLQQSTLIFGGGVLCAEYVLIQSKGLSLRASV